MAETILNVNDDEVVRYTVSRILRAAGFEIIEAWSGAEALEKLALRPDLVVLDVRLPDMHGFEVCRHIRELTMPVWVPVVYLSAVLVEEEHQAAGLESGGDGYVVYPMEPRVLIATVRALLRGRRAEAALAQTCANLEERVLHRTQELSSANVALEEEIIERRGANRQLRHHAEMLELIATGAPLTEVLTRIIRFLQEETSGLLGSIHVMSPEGVLVCAASPDLPPGFVEAAALVPVGPDFGSCGTAAWRQTEVNVVDIARDPLWARYAAIAREHGLQACWSTPVMNGDGAVLGTFAFYGREPGGPSPEDLEKITSTRDLVRIALKHHHALRDLQASEQRFRELTDNLDVAFWMYEPAKQAISYASPRANEVFGIAPEVLALSIAPLLEMIAPEDRPSFYARLHRPEGGEATIGEYRVRGKNGEVRWLRDRAVSVLNEQGEVTRVVGITADITGQRASEEALRLHDSAIQSVRDGIVIAGPPEQDNPVLFVNPAFTTLTGYQASEVMGWNCRFLQGERTDPEAVERLRTAIRKAEPCSVELLNYRKDGTTFWNSVSISPIRNVEGKVTHYVGTLSDVTARRELETQLLQAQKMEAVGKLAGGVAHDFNNMLAVINGYASILLRMASAESPMYTGLSEIARAGERAAGLTRQLLSFSRRAVREPRVLDLGVVVAEVEKLLHRLIGEDIELVNLSRPGVGLVRADPGQIEQVLMNLVVNSRDAMPQGGRIVVNTSSRRLSYSPSGVDRDFQPGPYLVLEVTDTGSGIDEKVVPHIFEPFFTTKPEGKGTGLGLSTVYGIVKQNGGHIALETVPGKGTTFRVYLPQVASAAEPEPEPAVEPQAGVETILLVEDESMLRNLVQRVLTGQGFTVLEASNGADAVQVAANYPHPIHLLLTDVVMPGGMSGRMVAETLTARKPELKVLYMSGYLDDDILRTGLEEASAVLIQKPFSPAVLVEKVRAILDGR